MFVSSRCGWSVGQQQSARDTIAHHTLICLIVDALLAHIIIPRQIDHLSPVDLFPLSVAAFHLLSSSHSCSSSSTSEFYFHYTLFSNISTHICAAVIPLSHFSWQCTLVHFCRWIEMNSPQSRYWFDSHHRSPLLCIEQQLFYFSFSLSLSLFISGNIVAYFAFVCSSRSSSITTDTLPITDGIIKWWWWRLAKVLQRLDTQCVFSIQTALHQALLLQ